MITPHNRRSPAVGTARASGADLVSLNPAELIVSRLDGVKKTARGWLAKCPAHADRHASLSIGEGSDGRVLLHCFAGCAAHDVLGAIGLSLTDLYPRKPRDLSPLGRAERRQVWQHSSTLAAAKVLAAEGFVIEMGARQIETGQPLSPEDCDRLRMAREACHGAVLALEGVR